MPWTGEKSTIGIKNSSQFRELSLIRAEGGRDGLNSCHGLLITGVSMLDAIAIMFCYS